MTYVLPRSRFFSLTIRNDNSRKWKCSAYWLHLVRLTENTRNLVGTLTILLLLHYMYIKERKNPDYVHYIHSLCGFVSQLSQLITIITHWAFKMFSLCVLFISWNRLHSCWEMQIVNCFQLRLCIHTRIYFPREVVLPVWMGPTHIQERDWMEKNRFERE